MDDKELYIGLMSGTSADSVDAAIIDFATTTPQLIACHSHPISNDIKQRIYQLATPAENEIDRLGVLDRELGNIFASATLALLEQAQIDPRYIMAIGSHGQTVRHRPPQTTRLPFTLQIGDPNDIATQTGITTVADFRRRDIAAGGQGAPLTPAFHQAVFQSQHTERMVVNIGGMANITHLPVQGPISGFDTGPGNVLMDIWTSQHRGEPFDKGGQWAASGDCNTLLLNQLLDHPFFHQTGPKSTGRETFNLAWLEGVLKNVEQPLSVVDIQATLLELTAASIEKAITALRRDHDNEIFICGGGTHNQQLLQRLQKRLAPISVAVTTTETLGLSPDWVEAAAFAWLARQTLLRLHGNQPSVTGAERNVILGGVYFN